MFNPSDDDDPPQNDRYLPRQASSSSADDNNAIQGTVQDTASCLQRSATNGVCSMASDRIGPGRRARKKRVGMVALTTQQHPPSSQLSMLQREICSVPSLVLYIFHKNSGQLFNRFPSSSLEQLLAAEMLSPTSATRQGCCVLRNTSDDFIKSMSHHHHKKSAVF